MKNSQIQSTVTNRRERYSNTLKSNHNNNEIVKSKQTMKIVLYLLLVACPSRDLPAQTWDMLCFHPQNLGYCFFK